MPFSPGTLAREGTDRDKEGSGPYMTGFLFTKILCLLSQLLILSVCQALS